MAGEPSHVKHLSLIHVCKIGLKEKSQHLALLCDVLALVIGVMKESYPFLKGPN
jgi:hypothetical protein